MFPVDSISYEVVCKCFGSHTSVEIRTLAEASIYERRNVVFIRANVDGIVLKAGQCESSIS